MAKAFCQVVKPNWEAGNAQGDLEIGINRDDGEGGDVDDDEDGDGYRGDNDKREEKDEVGEAEGC